LSGTKSGAASQAFSFLFNQPRTVQGSKPVQRVGAQLWMLINFIFYGFVVIF
jgi:hypothetical protein